MVVGVGGWDYTPKVRVSSTIGCAGVKSWFWENDAN